MAASEKAKRKEVEKEKEKEENSEAQKMPLGCKAQRTRLEFLCVGKERRRCKGERQTKRSKSPRVKQVLGTSGRWLFLLLILMQDWFCVDAAAGRLGPGGVAEVPEITFVSDAVEGTFVDLEGESHREQVEAKLFRREREKKKHQTKRVRRLKVRRGK